MEKIYLVESEAYHPVQGDILLVELNIFKENAFHGLQKIPLDNFPRNIYILMRHREWCVHAKNQDRSPSKLSS